MVVESESISQNQVPLARVSPEVNKHERHRLIAHLGRVFSRRYDIAVLPSGQIGLWACGLDPKVIPEVQRYIDGSRDALDDLPAQSFAPKQILYDEQAAMEMSMEQINTILHHEAGHAKYTDFRLMFEGQRHAKDEGYLPTSFWLMFEGVEDPRVNSLEGEESPVIDRQIRTNQVKDLQERITEAPLTQRPMMLQFAYDSFHYWLRGEGIPELKDTDVGRLGELARPLLRQYFENTDVEQRRLLQQQIWDIAKSLEKKEIEQEEMRQMAQQRQRGQPFDGAQGRQGQSGQSQGGSEERQKFQGQQGGMGEQPFDEAHDKQGQGSQSGRKRFLDRLKDTLLGQREKAGSGQKDTQDSSQKEQGTDGQSYDFGHEAGRAGKKQKPEKIDLSKLSQEELQRIKDAIDRLSPQERSELFRKAREAVDEAQKEALEEELGRTMKLEKNKKTGEYEVSPKTASEQQQIKAEQDFQQALQQVEEEERVEWKRQEEERRQQEEVLKQLENERRQKLEMEKAGFNEDEREKFLLYQSLEDAMYSYVRNFKQAIEKVIPRKKEPVYEGGYFSGPKFDRRDLIRKAPLGDEQFHMRQVERPIGEPRLFVGLLVDDTGSTAGKKQEEIRKASIFFAKALRDMNVPLMITSFGEEAEIIKKFNQDFDDPSQRIKPKLIDATDASANRTNLYEGIKATIEAMNEQRRRLRDSCGLIFVITDGNANAGLIGDALRDYIEDNRGRLTFKAFGLSGSDYERASIQNYLNNYFGESNCAYPQSFEDLPDEAFRVLRINLMQFQRFLS